MLNNYLIRAKTVYCEKEISLGSFTMIELNLIHLDLP